MTTRGIVCSATFDGATDTDTFLAFVGEALVPSLLRGQVVVMDNLSPHKDPRVREPIEDAGCRLLYLPPYSPDYNPIEQAISKVKSALRSATSRYCSTRSPTLWRPSRPTTRPRSCATAAIRYDEVEAALAWAGRCSAAGSLALIWNKRRFCGHIIMSGS